ncbi:MAG: purine-nucleoside phosphorylase [Propionibacteriaceae bacterium]|jgi:purine-nucleoside phosphorylase|nr:purine-nucleoside phosphorylase [Propionibacteriaceae bacterium]
MTTPLTDDYPYAVAEVAAGELRQRWGLDHVFAGIVLGSGWGPAAETWGEPLHETSMADVSGFVPPIAPGHAGRILHYRWSGRDVLVLSGRTHFFEGHGTAAVVHGVRMLAALGVRRLIVTNANGSFRPQWPLGQIVALTDHLNLSWVSPLVGARFVDLTDAYDPALRARALQIDPTLVTGVYAMFPGPHYETAAEAKMAATMGADVVGMSTVLEVIAAREFDMKVLALSIVTAHEASGEIIDPDEVVAVAQASARRTSGLLKAIIESD